MNSWKELRELREWYPKHPAAETVFEREFMRLLRIYEQRGLRATDRMRDKVDQLYWSRCRHQTGKYRPRDWSRGNGLTSTQWARMRELCQWIGEQFELLMIDPSQDTFSTHCYEWLREFGFKLRRDIAREAIRPWVTAAA